MKKYLDFIREFHDNNPIEIEFVNNHLKKHLVNNPENQNEIEQILDFLYSEKIDISKVWYTVLLEKTEKWHKKLQSVSSKDNEVEWTDYETYLDFWDGFKFVKLISKSCYEREGKLMSHCVASYFWRNSTIYSLRDSKNLPHCTIEDGQQIKGKGNWNIDPKYVDYVVKFLEKNGMNVWENEMKNLWYVDLEKLRSDLNIEFSDSTKKMLYKDKYYPVNKGIDWLKDKDNNPIRTLELLDYFPMFEEKENETSFSLKLALDIPLLAKWFVEFIKKSTLKNNVEKAGYNATVSAEDYATVSAGNYAKVSAEDYAKVSAEDYAKVSAEYYAKISAEDYAKVSVEDYAKVSAGYNAKVSAEDNATVSAGGNAKVSAGYNAKVSAGYNSKVSAGKHSILVAETDSKLSWEIWTILLITKREYIDWYYKITDWKAGMIDWKILKENTWYILKDGEFVVSE